MKKFGILFLTSVFLSPISFAADKFHDELMDLANKNHTEMHDMNATGNVDSDFAKMMAIHHQGAIDMAQAYLKRGGTDPELKNMANKMITEQKKEIQKLEKHSK